MKLKITIIVLSLVYFIFFTLNFSAVTEGPGRIFTHNLWLIYIGLWLFPLYYLKSNKLLNYKNICILFIFNVIINIGYVYAIGLYIHSIMSHR